MAQTLIVAAVVIVALWYLGRQLWRTAAGARRARDAGCGSGCGCDPAATPRAAERPARR